MCRLRALHITNKITCNKCYFYCGKSISLWHNKIYDIILNDTRINADEAFSCDEERQQNTNSNISLHIWNFSVSLPPSKYMLFKRVDMHFIMLLIVINFCYFLMQNNLSLFGTFTISATAIYFKYCAIITFTTFFRHFSVIDDNGWNYWSHRGNIMFPFFVF